MDRKAVLKRKNTKAMHVGILRILRICVVNSYLRPHFPELHGALASNVGVRQVFVSHWQTWMCVCVCAYMYMCIDVVFVYISRCKCICQTGVREPLADMDVCVCAYMDV